jgi:protein TonB
MFAVRSIPTLAGVDLRLGPASAPGPMATMSCRPEWARTRVATVAFAAAIEAACLILLFRSVTAMSPPEPPMPPVVEIAYEPPASVPAPAPSAEPAATQADTPPPTTLAKTQPDTATPVPPTPEPLPATPAAVAPKAPAPEPLPPPVAEAITAAPSPPVPTAAPVEIAPPPPPPRAVTRAQPHRQVHPHTAPAPPKTVAEVSPTAASPAAPVTAPAPATAAVAPPSDQQAVDQLRSHIHDAVQAALRYPAAARMMGLTGKAGVAFAYRDGAVVGAVQVERSAGMAMLDDAAIKAVRSAHYPKPPPALANRVLPLLIWVEFQPG